MNRVVGGGGYCTPPNLGFGYPFKADIFGVWRKTPFPLVTMTNMITTTNSEPPQAPAGTTTVEMRHDEPLLTETVHQIEFVEEPKPEAPAPPSAELSSNYDVDTIKNWCARAHFIQKQLLGKDQLIPNANVTLKSAAKGKLDYFRYVRFDMKLMLRWSVPKTEFGYLLVSYAPGTGYEAASAELHQFTPIKTLVNIQSGYVELIAPFFYPLPYLDLADSLWQLGTFRLSLVNRKSVNDTPVTPLMASMYVSYINMSVLTPTYRSFLPQGASLGKLLVGTAAAGAVTEFAMDATEFGMGMNDRFGDPTATNHNLNFGLSPASISKAIETFNADGQSAFRVFAENLNFMRQDGIDPSVPSSRVNLPLARKMGPYAFDNYNMLCAIPSYFEFETSNDTKLHLPLNQLNEWYLNVQRTHPLVRCDFLVRLTVFATSFHSGRYRVVYLSDASVVDDNADPSLGPSIIWDITDSASITFPVPYGNNRPFSAHPTLTIMEEVQFRSGFTPFTAPLVIAEVTCTNINVLGLRVPDPISTNIRWHIPARTSDNPNVESLRAQTAAALPITGFRDFAGTSDDMTNVSLVTTARRPCILVNLLVDSPYEFTADAEDGYFIVDPISAVSGFAPYRFKGYISNFLASCGGFRGSIKVCVRIVNPDVAASDAFEIHPSYSDHEFCPGLVCSGYGEIQLPYMTWGQFYNFDVIGTTGATHPSIQVTSADPTAIFNVYVGFYEDFEVLFPTSPIIPP
uniref:Structural polyprotein n=1 Tax=Indotermes dicistro-like virus 2 TaxID=3032219 RepID=A0AAT9J9X7_9VIRU